MKRYSQLLELIPDLEKIKEDNSLSMQDVREKYIEAMNDEMVFEYMEVLSQYIDINEEVVSNFDMETILAYLTSTIRNDRFFDRALSYSIRSGVILTALKRLSILVDKDISN